MPTVEPRLHRRRTKKMFLALPNPSPRKLQLRHQQLEKKTKATKVVRTVAESKYHLDVLPPPLQKRHENNNNKTVAAVPVAVR